MKQKVSVDVRVDASTKARWQIEADAAGLSVGELVRRRMQNNTPLDEVAKERAARASVDLAAEELQPLRSWVDLRDSDGLVDDELRTQRAEWGGYADRRGIAVDDLLGRVFLDVNAGLLV